MRDHVYYDDAGKLDEIVAARGAYLERMGKDEWFLEFLHEDGTSTAIWFKSKDLVKPCMETRPAKEEQT